jgi:SAM-dependent methyltransferase
MTEPGRSRWTDRTDVPRGDAYDQRFADLEAAGTDVHGEADLVWSLDPGPRILDAGCGTGRVAIELARRGASVTGLDIDPRMLDAARRKAPELTWIEGDLATATFAEPFDAVVLAGNVLIFVTPGTEADVLQRCATALVPGGLLVAGFQVQPGGYTPAQLDAHAGDAGLEVVDRWSTWDRAPWDRADGYQVSVHRRR